MNVTFFVLLIVGLGMLVRGLMTVSRSRAVWMARSVAATATVVACRPVERSDGPQFATFAISVRYIDAQGQPCTADLPAAQEFAPGDPVDVRFDPKHPATVYLSEQFAGTDLPAALIVFGGLLVLVSFSFVTD
jgi:Protein of unknown function (DUF3592)